MTICKSLPGCPSDEVTCTPATRPARLSSKLKTGALRISCTFAFAIAPVKSLRRPEPYAVITTSSSNSETARKRTVSFFPSATVTVCFSYPIKEISKFILSPSTRIEKFPSKSLIVPTLFPATATEAPIIGSPVSKSITEPTTVRVFACWAIATLFIFETSSAECTTEEKEIDKYTRLQHLMYHFAFEITAFFMVQYLISR